MKILLVSPACGKWKGIGRRKVFNGKTFRFSMLSLLTVAELSPPDAEITIVDEQVEDIPFDERFDVVGITAMTATAPRAYEIAARFRQRHIPVVLGGWRNFMYLLVPNLAYYGRTKRFGIKGYDPSEALGSRSGAEIMLPRYACGPVEA